MHDPLSLREEETLRLAALGLTNGEIAKKQWVTMQTVKFHMHNVNRKLGTTNRLLAVRRAMELGLVELPIRLDDEVKGCPHCGKAYV